MASFALLRGINVGGHRKLPMAELRSLCADLGMTEVKTYIQSGNVRFVGGSAAGLQAAIHDRYGYDVVVVERTAAQLQAVVDRRPFGSETDDKRTHVVFLDGPPVLEALPERLPDRSLVVGREVYLQYAVGPSKSKLQLAWIERQLGARGTARNWRTLGKLLAMA